MLPSHDDEPLYRSGTCISGTKIRQSPKPFSVEGVVRAVLDKVRQRLVNGRLQLVSSRLSATP